MGMMIDNSIRLLEDYLEWQKLHKMDGNGVDEATRNLIDVAKKYQKIEQVYNSWRTGDYKGSIECMEEIGEVLNDGNDNN